MKMMKMMRNALRIVVVGCFLWAGSPGKLSAVPSAETPPPVPAFSVVSLDGKTVGSANLTGTTYIVNFFASWCPPCRSEIPDMVVLQNQYGRKGFTFIGVAVNETEPTIREFIKKNKINYPVVMANEQIVNAFSRYVDGGIRAIPTSFVVNSSGKISQVITGARSKEVFEKIILDAQKKRKISK
ncbi:MAG: TlpA disulfide reductase family protein [Chlorobiaceae bacterium]